MSKWASIVAVIAGLAAVDAAAASEVAPASLQEVDGPAFMRVFGQTMAPSGFTRMCERQSDLCERGRPGESRVTATREVLKELAEVNLIANRTVEPASDEEIYGTSEYWTVPGRRGDCEDYALLKQRMLTERGWPKAALLITVVRDENGEGHALLTARTSRGDYILDNRYDEVVLWSSRPYAYVKRQSYLDPRIWVSLVPSEDKSDGLVASEAPNDP